MDMVMEMATAVTPLAVDTASTATHELTETNKNGMCMRRSEAMARAVGPGHWRRRMSRTAQQQARGLAQRHRTIAKMANMLETQTALQEAQGRGMQKWTEEHKQKRDAYHQDD